MKTVCYRFDDKTDTEYFVMGLTFNGTPKRLKIRTDKPSASVWLTTYEPDEEPYGEDMDDYEIVDMRSNDLKTREGKPDDAEE